MMSAADVSSTLAKIATEMRQRAYEEVDGPGRAAVNTVANAIESVLHAAPGEAPSTAEPSTTPRGGGFDMLRHYVKEAKRVAPGVWFINHSGNVNSEAAGRTFKPLDTTECLAFVCEAANAVPVLLASYDRMHKSYEECARDLDDLESAVRDHLPEYDIDGEGGGANLIERVEYVADDLEQHEKKAMAYEKHAKQDLAVDVTKTADMVRLASLFTHDLARPTSTNGELLLGRCVEEMAEKLEALTAWARLAQIKMSTAADVLRDSAKDPAATPTMTKIMNGYADELDRVLQEAPP